MRIGYIVRTYDRLRVTWPVRYTGRNGSGMGVIRNVSRSGWKIQGNFPVEVGMSLMLSIDLPGETPKMMVQDSEVRWVQDDLFGIQIKSMHPAHWDSLHRLVTRLMQQKLTTRPR